MLYRITLPDYRNLLSVNLPDSYIINFHDCREDVVINSFNTAQVTAYCNIYQETKRFVERPVVIGMVFRSIKHEHGVFYFINVEM